MNYMLVASFVAISLFTIGKVRQTPPDGYQKEPNSGHGRGVLVLHPWWGLNADVKAFCDRLAANGFVAFAPDLFHGKIAHTEAEAQALVNEHETHQDQIESQISRAAEFLSARTGKQTIAVVGFSFGANYALHASVAQPVIVHAVVAFYGTGPTKFDGSRAAYLGHFAEKDQFEPKSEVDALAQSLHAAGRPVKFFTYPGTGHWFFEPSVKKAYNRSASNLAWKRTLTFLNTELPPKATQ